MTSPNWMVSCHIYIDTNQVVPMSRTENSTLHGQYQSADFTKVWSAFLALDLMSSKNLLLYVTVHRLKIGSLEKPPKKPRSQGNQNTSISNFDVNSSDSIRSKTVLWLDVIVKWQDLRFKISFLKKLIQTNK